MAAGLSLNIYRENLSSFPDIYTVKRHSKIGLSFSRYILSVATAQPFHGIYRDCNSFPDAMTTGLSTQAGTGQNTPHGQHVRDVDARAEYVDHC